MLVAAVLGGVGLAATVVLGRRPRATEAADDADGDPLQAALDAVRPGGEYVIDRAWTRSRSLVVRHPLLLRFTGAGAIRMVTGASAVLVQASDVEIVDAVITGVGADSGGLGHGIAVMGLRGGPLHGITVRRGRFRDIPHDGVHLEYCDRFEITGTTIERSGYAGIVGVGVVDGAIDGNTVRDVRQPARRVNSYGITLTRDARYATSEARRSARVRVTGNRIAGVPAWEGIDTHAGEDIEIRGNVVTGCRVGIAAVPSKDPADREQTSVAPIGLLIADNTVTRSPGLAPGSAIVVSGAGTTVGSTRPRATGVVSGNVVTGGGGSSGEAGILLKLTRGMVVARNRVEASVENAVCLAHSNAAVSVRANRIVGVGGSGVGVNVRAGANHGAITRNHFESTPHALAVAVRFGDADNRFAVRRNTWGTARVRIAHGGATVTTD
ncbi:right-handed parallel beta-helix repeat-containing protein [Curtobacterium flaccumfaciens pv. flaccumfaciens]|uniref:right-handed parallel beta-helix repeat-containing protein n=1 Tax=Curtobacterium flaccumfaciens TaxID=2035 RepID=UPI001BDF6A5A|nr:right-handed parallel beta-helix repeat-containing protein [Curtobacterium flaccumfaciens]MBT1682860.1 right-handed parallel beta-helix repeat-containing protein [Curtobacterium flaccumfaciens pv. flaccumfaciens]MCS6548019.1 right-handed parallel beta-helix repeat-containing protein [Curtobacterium flaccumfaciens pv. flaccumfaciens]